ncbi:serine hydrolase, partial [Rhizobiaceae sp. 2RAB30]
MSASGDGALAGRLDAIIDGAVEKGTIVGTVVLVARDGRLVYHRAAGFADREAGRVMSEDTIFRLASVTKPMV